VSNVKTVYVRDEDLPLWDKLAEVAAAEKRSVSFMLGVLIKQHLVFVGAISDAET
jgi:hypothetical protein